MVKESITVDRLDKIEGMVDSVYRDLREVKQTLEALIAEIESADHWLKHTEVFDRAKEAVNKL